MWKCAWCLKVTNDKSQQCWKCGRDIEYVLPKRGGTSAGKGTLSPSGMRGGTPERGGTPRGVPSITQGN